MFRQFCCALFAVMLFAPVTHCVVVRAEDEVAQPADRFAVPEKDVAAIVEFLKRLETYEPKNSVEILALRKAFQTAADRIIHLERDKSSNAYRKAQMIQLQLRLSEVQRGNAQTQRDFYNDLLAQLNSTKSLTQQDLALAYTFGRLVEDLGNVTLAKNAYAEFGKLFSASNDEVLSGYGETMAGIARRLDLPGKPMHLEGKTTSGQPLDWKAYRGKVVLVDYWATWCPPCLEELPNVKENYAKYHDKGFEVVGISLDTYAGPLRRFLAEHEVPWDCLFEEGAGTDHPMAKYYGVMRTPTTMLLDREGKVVAIDVYGEELDVQLERLLGTSKPAGGASE